MTAIQKTFRMKKTALLSLTFLSFSALLLTTGTGKALATRAAVLAFDCATVSQIPLGDCNALVALYGSTSGAAWTDNTGWLITNTPCTTPWFGVACAGGRVNDLDLRTNNLSGTIPVEIGGLTALGGLDLSDNSLTGSLPTEIGNLTLLDFLSVSTNQLSGTLPSSLGNLTVVNMLWLDNNQFSGGIPTTFGNFTLISDLEIWNNQLSGSIPTELGNLGNLNFFSLHNNRLSGALPASLGGLSNLFSFQVQNNALEGDVPASYSGLSNVITGLADFGYNKLTASDAGVIAWLNGVDPDWAQTQTVPPANPGIGAVTVNSIELTWTPINYTAHGGYYEVYFASSSTGPFSLHGATGDKTASGYTAGGLSGNSTYFFCVRTYTPTHGSQQNELWSGFSPTVSGSTLELLACPAFIPTATPTPTATPSNTPIPPTATNTPLPTATNTPLPTATNTPLPTATSTPLSTATNTPPPTATNTPPPPTATPTTTATPEFEIYLSIIRNDATTRARVKTILHPDS